MYFLGSCPVLSTYFVTSLRPSPLMFRPSTISVPSGEPSISSAVIPYVSVGNASDRQSSFAGGWGISNAHPPTVGKVAPRATPEDKAHFPRNRMSRSSRALRISFLMACSCGTYSSFHSLGDGTRRVGRSKLEDQSSE